MNVALWLLALGGVAATPPSTSDATSSVGWDGSAGWDPNGELWRFQPPWNWDSPYPPNGTTYLSKAPAREIGSRRSFRFAADRGVSLVGARVDDGRLSCSDKDWCVHMRFLSSYGALSHMDAWVLDRYDSVEPLRGDGIWDAMTKEEGSL
ncbi:hypothetical protein BBJ28_00009674, partial [Nothophytophthora sp. Chile5]